MSPLPLVENPGIQAIDVWRNLENRTHVLVVNPDNGNVFIAMHNITGRGTWISAGFTIVQGGAAVSVEVSYNIDGAGAVSRLLTTAGINAGYGEALPLFFGFETSLVVEMRLSGAGNADFQSVAIVE